MLDAVEDMAEFVRNLIIRFIGLVFVLVGLLVVFAALLPSNLEQLFILFVGVLCVGLGGFALVLPHRVSTKRTGEYDEDSGMPHRHRRH